MRAAFDVLGQEAAKDNNNAFQALKKCLGNPHLKAFAPGALGIAAAAGHKGALEILLHHDPITGFWCGRRTPRLRGIRDRKLGAGRRVFCRNARQSRQRAPGHLRHRKKSPRKRRHRQRRIRRQKPPWNNTPPSSPTKPPTRIRPIVGGGAVQTLWFEDGAIVCGSVKN